MVKNKLHARLRVSNKFRFFINRYRTFSDVEHIDNWIQKLEILFSERSTGLPGSQLVCRDQLNCPAIQLNQLINKSTGMPATVDYCIRTLVHVVLACS
jgi:hypothetical protein